MNKIILMGRLVRNPEVRYTQGNNPMCVARYSLAVVRKGKKGEGQQSADFISCVAFGKAGEFAEGYLKQGIKVLITGRLQTGSYTNREGVKVYTTEVVIEEQEFAESKGAAGGSNSRRESPEEYPTDEDGFMSIPDGIDDELPFS